MSLFVCFIIVLVFRFSSCLVPDMLVNNIKNALCKLQCVEKNVTHCNPSVNCICEAVSFNETDLLNLGLLDIDQPDVHCIQQNIISMRWKNVGVKIYFLEVSTDGGIADFTELTTCNLYTLSGLKADNLYGIKLWAVDLLGNIYSSIEVTLRTFSNDYIPLRVPEIWVDKLIVKEATYDAALKWSPAEDMSCYYELIWICTDLYDCDILEQSGIVDPESLYTFNIIDLQFDGNYSVAIMAKSANMMRESPNTTISIHIPSCLDTYNDLTKCVPPSPELLGVFETVAETDEEATGFVTYDLFLNWSQPELNPDYYLAQIHILTVNHTGLHMLNISGEKTNAVAKKIKLGLDYVVSLRAVSEGGTSVPTISEYHFAGVHPPMTKELPNTDNKVSQLIVFITFGSVLMLLLFIGLLIMFLKRNAQISRTKKRGSYFQDMGKSTDKKCHVMVANDQFKQTKDEWEIDSRNLNLQILLGEGAFGIVRRAVLELPTGGIMEVAAKMLKDNPTEEEVRAFRHEIEIMKSVRSHPHIVSIIGCINSCLGPVLVVEYCTKGDLLTYLRKIWDALVNRKPSVENSYTFSDGAPKHFSNKLYEYNENEEDTFPIETKYVISFGRQIAMGMEYLSNQKVLHRDLAARNILICDDGTLKVSDFGLSRDVYIDNVYCKTTGGKLPVRWMAVESLTHHRYTTKSDVWSFGIVMWEIVSLGANPYPGIQSQDLQTLLRSGYRMPQPSHCSSDIYSIMTECWKESPRERPSFSTLRQAFEKLLEHFSGYLEIPVHPCHDEALSASCETYMKPVDIVSA